MQCASQPSQCLDKTALGQEDAQSNDRVSLLVDGLRCLSMSVTRRSTCALGLSCQHLMLCFQFPLDSAPQIHHLSKHACCICSSLLHASTVRSLLNKTSVVQVKPKRVRPQVELRPLTQDELLAEAARTELDNLRDLEQMVALEEATRKKAMYKRSKYSGPMIRFHSKRIEEVALVSLCTCNWPCVHNLKLTLSTFCAAESIHFLGTLAELFGSQTFHSA